MKTSLLFILLISPLFSEGASTPQELLTQFNNAFNSKDHKKLFSLFLNKNTPEFILKENSRTIIHQLKFPIVSSEISKLSENSLKRINTGIPLKNFHPSIIKNAIIPKEATYLYPNLSIEGQITVVLKTPEKNISVKYQFGKSNNKYLFSLCQFSKI